MKPALMLIRACVVLALVIASAPAGAAVKINDVTTSPNSASLNNASTLDGFTTRDGRVIDTWQLVGVSAAQANNAVSSNNIFKGDLAGSYPATIAAAFTDNDPTTGYTNTFDLTVLFDRPIGVNDLNQIVAAVFEVGDTGQNDSWTVNALLNDNLGAPSYGSNFTAGQQSFFGDTGTDIVFERPIDGSPLTQSLLGAAITAGDLGLAVNDVIYGVRVRTSAGDPGLIVGVIPTPAAAPLGLLGLAMLNARRRRR